MPGTGWSYSTSDQALGLGRVSSDGKAQLMADKATFQSDYYHQRVNSMLNYQDELLAFAASYKAGQEGMHFNLWRSIDGENWINETPSIPDIPAYVSVSEAVEGPKGIVAVGWESPMEDGGLGTPLPIALFSADGETWSFSTFGQEWEKYYRIAANEEAYFAYESDNQVWTSTDGQSWTDLSPLQYYKFNIDNEWISYPLSSFRLIAIVGFPEGLVAVGEKSVLFSGQLPFDYLNQK